VGLLAAAHRAVKAVDPGAKIVLAGLPDYAWIALARIYRVSGARNDFDIVAAHPYTSTPAGVIEILGFVRAVMNRHGDSHKPMLVTETGWSSTAGTASDDYCCQTTRHGQATKIARLLPLLAANRTRLGLLGFYYYTWAGEEYTGAPSFNFAGLLNFTGTSFIAKPSLRAFTAGALALERCRQKARIATRCSR
jgi:hypothetical protein